MQEFQVIDEYDVNLKQKGNVWSHHEMIGVMLSFSLKFFFGLKLLPLCCRNLVRNQVIWLWYIRREVMMEGVSFKETRGWKE